MKGQDVKKIITTLEQVRNISGEQLCQGLCTPMMMGKIELGEKIPEKLLLDALLQRLGESPNKMETLISWEEYEKLCEREEIEGNILEEHYDAARKLLNEYIPNQEATEYVERQWLYTQLYNIAKGTGGSQKEAMTCLENALAATVPDWENIQKTERLLSAEEVSLFLTLIQELLIQEYLDGEKKRNVKGLLNRLIQYMERHFADEEELVKIYPKAIVLYAECHTEETQAKKVIDYCEKALELVTHHNALYYLLELLDILIERLPCVGRGQEVRRYQRQRESLAAVYEEYGALDNQNNREMKSRKREYQLFHEVVRSERIAHDLSQEEMIEGVYASPETLSRVENGRTRPRVRKFEELMEKLDVDIAKYNTRLDVENFEINQMVIGCTLCAGRFEYEKARKIYNAIASLIDSKNKINRQWLLFMKTVLDWGEEQIDAEEALEQCMKALELTYLYQSNGIYRVPLRREAEIFNVMAQSYIEMKDKIRAFKLREALLEVYRNSKMSVQYHGISYLLILSSYALEKGNANITEGVIELCDEGMMLLLKIGSGTFLGKYSLIKGCTYELIDREDKEKSHRELSRKYICQAAHLCDLFEKNINREQIREYYNNHYDKDYEWD